MFIIEVIAIELLKKDEITGYMILEENGPKVIVTTNGINETIFKYVIEEISQTEEIMKNIAQKKIENYISNNQVEDFNNLYERIYGEVLEITQNQEVNIKDISSKNLSYTMIEFYTLIAMSCLYGSIFGMTAINRNLPNMSNNGKRVAVSPIGKGKLIISSVLAGYIIALIGLALLFIYTVFVLNVDYGTNIFLIIILGIIGSFAGLSMGLMIGAIVKTNENTKNGIIIAVTMFGCFLSGMMGITMKYIVDKNLPILNKINPASMITDGFYSLYYYDTLDRYFFNIASLLIFAVIMILLSYISLRRQKYDSI